MYLVTRYWQDDWVIFLLLQFIRQMPCRCPLSQTRWWTRLKEDPGLESVRYEDNPQSISYVLKIFYVNIKRCFIVPNIWSVNWIFESLYKDQEMFVAFEGMNKNCPLGYPGDKWNPSWRITITGWHCLGLRTKNVKLTRW